VSAVLGSQLREEVGTPLEAVNILEPLEVEFGAGVGLCHLHTHHVLGCRQLCVRLAVVCDLVAVLGGVARVAVPHGEAHRVLLYVAEARRAEGAADGEVEDDARDEEEDDAAPTVITWPPARQVVVDVGQAANEDDGQDGNPEELEGGHLVYACYSTS
jgi:hypothetical protein